MATHSRILAWRIPWTEEPGRLGVRRIWHHLVTKPSWRQTFPLIAPIVAEEPLSHGSRPKCPRPSSPRPHGLRASLPSEHQ